MDTVVYDAIEKLQAKADEIKLAVDEFGEMLEDIQAFTNETNIVVKDILNGRQLSEWIADLAASGKSSATYADASRMQALIEDKDACKNVTANQYILDWGAANNKVGAFFNSIVGSVSGVTWSSLTTLTQVCSNASAFQAVANDSSAFDVIVTNDLGRDALFSCYSTTESVIADSSVALNILDSMKKTRKFNQADSSGSNLRWFVLSYTIQSLVSMGNSSEIDIVCADNTTVHGEAYESGKVYTRSVNKFAKSYTYDHFSSDYNSAITYVDFS